MADIMHSANVGMVQRRYGVGFAIETLPGLGIVREMTWQDLDRDRAVQASVLRSIHLSHPARADGREDLIRAEASSGGKGHGNGTILLCPGAKTLTRDVIVRPPTASYWRGELQW